MGGRWSGRRVVAGPDWVGVGVVVLEGSVVVGVKLAMECCVDGADADLAETTS